MNICIPKKSLVQYLERADGIADKKSPVPALANALLRAEGRSVEIAATDLYLAMQASADAEVTTPGAIALPAKDLLERVRAMPDGPIQIAVDGVTATVKAVGHARRYTLQGIPAADFPSLPKPPEDSWKTIPAGALKHLLDLVHQAISTDETRPHVNSVLLEADGNVLRAVSTDGHRLHKAEVKSEMALREAGDRRDVLVPLKAVTEMRRLLDKQGEVALCIGGPNLFLRLGSLTWTCKLVDALFPPFQQVLAKVNETDPRVPRLPFIDALKAIQLAASDRTGGVKLALVPGALRITSESPESGNAFDEIAVDYAGPEKKVGVNAKYMLDALACLDDEEVMFHMDGELEPMAIAAPGSDAFNATIMPMRI
jgi:DNA polymerase-3 subunit beta